MTVGVRDRSGGRSAPAVERGHSSVPTKDLHVIFLDYFYTPYLRTPHELLARYSTLKPIAMALRNLGARVTLFQRFRESCNFNEDGIEFRFCMDRCDPKLRKWQVPLSLHSTVREICKPGSSRNGSSVVVHVHGMFHPVQMRFLRSALPSDCAIVAQHHAERPWGTILRPVQRWGLRAADGFFFAAQDLAVGWTERGLISGRQRVFEVMEGSNSFHHEERVAARSRTGMAGSPTVLWVGNLTANKDPLTVLAGFEEVVQQVPKARLYMAYRGTDLLDAVRSRIAGSPLLCKAVMLLGGVPHAQLEDIYNSADYFVLGSHYEGSGFALAEAMACGVVPVVTDICSFRAMTDNGRIGGCWTAGESRSLSSVFLEVLRKPVGALATQAIHFFDQHLSYPAIARAAMDAYRELIFTRTGRAL